MYLFIFVFPFFYFFFNKAGKTKAARESTAINQNILVLPPVFTGNKAKWMLSASSSFRTTTVSKVHSQKQYRDASVFVLHSFLLPLAFSPTSLPSHSWLDQKLVNSSARARLIVCRCLRVQWGNNERYEKNNAIQGGEDDTGAHCYRTFSENVKNPTLPQWRGGGVRAFKRSAERPRKPSGWLHWPPGIVLAAVQRNPLPSYGNA